MAEDKIQEEQPTDINYKSPLGVTADEDGPVDCVRVCVVFPGLKKKFFKNAAKNAELDVKFETRSFTLLLTMNKDKYRYAVRRLPDEILPDNCHHKVKKGQVVLFLKKAKSRSWERELAETGIETFVEEDDE